MSYKQVIRKLDLNSFLTLLQYIFFMLKRGNRSSLLPLNLVVVLAVLILTLTSGSSLPSSAKAKNDPVKNFEAFWSLFNENYAFFKLKKVDWVETYKAYRPKVSSNTTDSELFVIFSEMVAPLHDSHVNIITPDKHFSASKPSRFLKEFSSDSLVKEFWNMCDLTLVKNGFSPIKSFGTEYEGEKLFHYSESNQIAYLRFTRSFVSLEKHSGSEEKLIQKSLDTLFKSWSNKKGLILDVRLNIGGEDRFSYNMAGRLTRKRVIGHSKKTKRKGSNKYGKLKTFYINPNGNSNFLQPTMVLTNDQTASAADVFSLIVKPLPNVDLIGENSEGIYSDMLEKKLPNGWIVTLSNQVYYSNEMICYEGIGTPVDTVIRNTLQDLTMKEDPVIMAALVELNKR